MKKMKIISNAHSEKLREDFKMSDLVAFIQGQYMVEALLCTVGNMFGKNANFSYPEQAYSLNKSEKELTEDEIELQRQQFIAALQTMQHNFNINKEKKQNISFYAKAEHDNDETQQAHRYTQTMRSTVPPLRRKP